MLQRQFFQVNQRQRVIRDFVDAGGDLTDSALELLSEWFGETIHLPAKQRAPGQIKPQRDVLQWSPVIGDVGQMLTRAIDEMCIEFFFCLLVGQIDSEFCVAYL